MPSRVIDFEALWLSDKLAACDSSMRVEYLWCYGVADAFGSFELNLRAIHARVSAIRPRLTLQRVEKLFAEFELRGLLFTWQENGKRWGHWVGSERPGRLPRPSDRHKYKKLAPNVPKEGLAAYVSRCSREGIATNSPTGLGVGVGVGYGVGLGVRASNPENPFEAPLREGEIPKPKKTRKVDRYGNTLLKQEDDEPLPPPTPAELLQRAESEIEFYSKMLQREKMKLRPEPGMIRTCTAALERAQQKKASLGP